MHSCLSRSQGFTKSKFLETHAFMHMCLEPLTKRQQEQIVENRLGRNAVKPMRQHIEKLVDFEGATICGNPLMLSMVISIFQASGAEDFPKTRFELYQSAVSTMLTRLDFKDIGQRSQVQGQHVRLVLAEIAADRQQARDKDITEEHVGQVIAARDDKLCPLADAWKHVKAQVLQGKLPLLSCLESSPLKLRFAHLSLQEFLCVEKWLAMVDAGNQFDAVLPPLSTMLNDGWWLNSLTMACEGRPELAAALFGESEVLTLAGLEGEPPLSMLPELIHHFCPGTRSLDLRFVSCSRSLMSRMMARFLPCTVPITSYRARYPRHSLTCSAAWTRLT